MSDKLEKISDEDIPAKDTDMRGWWRAIAPAAHLVNALLDFKIVTDSGKNQFTLTEGNAMLELDIPATTTSAAELFPWQPYPSPYTGTGTAPANQGLKIRIRPGYVTDPLGDLIPARRNIEITVPANCTDGYYVWLVANLDGDGNMTALDYDHGTTPPARDSGDDEGDDDGPPTLPAVVYRLLFFVTSNATQVNDFSNVFEKSLLNLYPVITGYDVPTQTVTRAMQWTAVSPIS